MKRVLFLIISMTFTTFIIAQTPLKMGHINFQELIVAMPENDSVKIKIENLTKELQETYQNMVVEYKTKKQDYDSKSSTYSDLIKKTKQAELADIEQRIGNLQQTASVDIQKQRDNLYQPILDKAKKAISDVGKENGLIYIFDISQGGIDYFSESSVDVLPQVKQKLGLLTTKQPVRKSSDLTK